MQTASHAALSPSQNPALVLVCAVWGVGSHCSSVAAAKAVCTDVRSDPFFVFSRLPLPKVSPTEVFLVFFWRKLREHQRRIFPCTHLHPPRTHTPEPPANQTCTFSVPNTSWLKLPFLSSLFLNKRSVYRRSPSLPPAQVAPEHRRGSSLRSSPTPVPHTTGFAIFN